MNNTPYEKFKSTSGYGRGLWTLFLGMTMIVTLLVRMEKSAQAGRPMFRNPASVSVEPISSHDQDLVQRLPQDRANIK